MLVEYSDRASLEELDFPNGPLEADSPLYVLRSPLEETACQKLLEPGSLLQVQGRRYMGKCSFLNHVTGYGKNQGYWSVTVNFQDAPSTVLNDLGSFLRWFSLTVGHQLRLKNRLESYGLSESFDGQTCSEYFETYLLPASSFPIILVLKELDYLFTHPAIAPAFFELLHSWHQKAQNNDTWSNLRLVFVHATSAVPLLYSSAPQFQTDAPLVLSEFSLAQTQQLASRYGLEWAFDDVKAQRLVSLLNMVGGSPYRLAIAFYGLRVGELSLSEIMQIADEPNTIYGPHLQRLERRLAQKPYLKTVFTKVMRANDWVEIDTADAYQLEKLGLAVFNGTAVRTSCMLYQRYFETRLSEPKDPASVRRHSLEAEHITLQDLARTPDAALERSSKDHPLPSDTLCDLAELPIVEPSLPTAQDENLPPKPLLGGRYYLQAQLGSGGFGETFLAQDTHRPGQPACVVKKLATWFKAEELAIARRLFATEAQTLEQLGQHDQIPRLLAYFEQNAEFYLVQEFIEGQPLVDEIGQCITGWDEAQIINFLNEILPILSFVHDHRVIHRDLKPDNIIRRQSDGKLVLIDFGVAKHLSIGDTNTGRRTIAVGTSGYMPWEQNQGTPQVNSDLYAVGMIAIEAATGIHPDRLERDNAMVLQWRSGLPLFNPWLAAILDGMVQANYRNRYQTAQEVLKDLNMIAPAL